MANSTQMFSGHDGRNSSRVLAPPGGRTSNIFGFGDEPAPQSGRRHVGPNPNAEHINDPVEPQRSGRRQFQNPLPSAAGHTLDPAPVPQTYSAQAARKQAQGHGNIIGHIDDTEDEKQHSSRQSSARTLESARQNYVGHGNIISGSPLQEEEPRASVAALRESQGHGNIISGDIHDIEPLPITKEVQAEADRFAAEQKKPHTSTRVRQPPGGVSSGLW